MLNDDTSGMPEWAFWINGFVASNETVLSRHIITYKIDLQRITWTPTHLTFARRWKQQCIFECRKLKEGFISQEWRSLKWIWAAMSSVRTHIYKETPQKHGPVTDRKGRIFKINGSDKNQHKYNIEEVLKSTLPSRIKNIHYGLYYIHRKKFYNKGSYKYAS